MDQLFRALRLFSIFGAAVCLSTLLLSDFCGESPKYAQSLSVKENEILNDGDSEVSVDPFGYFGGKWNLWEFIGDSISSIIQ